MLLDAGPDPDVKDGEGRGLEQLLDETLAWYRARELEQWRRGWKRWIRFELGGYAGFTCLAVVDEVLTGDLVKVLGVAWKACEGSGCRSAFDRPLDVSCS